MSNDGWEDAPLGEASEKRKYWGGAEPAFPMVPLLVGDAACLRDGENPDLPENEPECEDFGRFAPPACYGTIDSFEQLTNILACRVQYHLCRILEKQYTDLPAAEGMARVYFGNDIDVRRFPQITDTFPNMMTVKVDDAWFIFVTGTNNYWQFVMQGLRGIFAMENEGLYSAGKLYEDAALVMFDRLRVAGFAAPSRVCLIGHSYGGAIVQVMAAKFAIAHPEWRVEMLTFGTAKAGDLRLTTLNLPWRQAHLVAFDDPVPFLPPDASTQDRFLDIAGILEWIQGRPYKRPQPQFLITADHEIRTLDVNLIDVEVQRAVVKLIQAFLDSPPFAGHFTRSYTERILEACDGMDGDCDEFPDEPFDLADPFELEITYDFDPIQPYPYTDLHLLERKENWKWGNPGFLLVESNPIIESPISDTDRPLFCKLTLKFAPFAGPPEVPVFQWADLPEDWWDGGTHAITSQFRSHPDLLPTIGTIRVVAP